MGCRTVNWITVWGYGADITAAGNTLFIRKKDENVPAKYPLNEVSHLLIAGDNILHTAVIGKCQEHGIPISFFDIRGKPAGCLFKGTPRFSGAQDKVPVLAYAKAVVESSLEARMRYLHELAEKQGKFYLKGEFELLAQARSDISYAGTVSELARLFSVTRNMYYEILSRAVPADLGYKRRIEFSFADPVNTLLSKGYAALYATVHAACIGAGLDPAKSMIFGKSIPCSGKACVCEIMEPALVPMVDRVVIGLAKEGLLSDAKLSGSRWIFSEKADSAFSKRLAESIDRFCIESNVRAYAESVAAGKAPEYHYPA